MKKKKIKVAIKTKLMYHIIKMKENLIAMILLFVSILENIVI